LPGFLEVTDYLPSISRVSHALCRCLRRWPSVHWFFRCIIMHSNSMPSVRSAHSYSPWVSSNLACMPLNPAHQLPGNVGRHDTPRLQHRALTSASSLGDTRCRAEFGVHLRGNCERFLTRLMSEKTAALGRCTVSLLSWLAVIADSLYDRLRL
jgi:hypothetical protein